MLCEDLVACDVRHGRSCNLGSYNFHSWKEIPEKDKHEISDPREVPLFNVINGWRTEDKEVLDRCLIPRDLGHYTRTEIPWLFRAKELVAQELKVPIAEVSEQDQLIPNLDRYGTPLKYKLYYAARFPDKMEIRENLSQAHIALVADFFSDCFQALRMEGLDYLCHS